MGLQARRADHAKNGSVLPSLGVQFTGRTRSTMRRFHIVQFHSVGYSMKSPSLARLGPARNQSLRCNGGAALSILYCIASPHDHMKERMKAMRTVRLVPIKALIGALVVLLCPAAWAQHAGGGALGHG